MQARVGDHLLSPVGTEKEFAKFAPMVTFVARTCCAELRTEGVARVSADADVGRELSRFAQVESRTKRAFVFRKVGYSMSRIKSERLSIEKLAMQYLGQFVP